MDWMKDDGIFMPMINDTGRNQFYKAAIQRAVSGKTVCDIGTGTGLLSILAVKSGAKKVFAVEQDTDRADLARQMFKRIGIADQVEVIEADFLTTDICADIYVSETINTQIFGENIISLAEHARKYKGQFIPDKFEISLHLYENHPIFPLCQMRSDAFEFQPDIAIDPVFEQAVNTQFQQTHPLSDTLYRANVLNGLFTQLPKFTDLKLTRISESEPITVDLNQPVDIDSIRLIAPRTLQNSSSNVYAVIHWKAYYQDIVLNVNSTWFGNPSKTILQRCRNTQLDITTWYDPAISDWRFQF
jgi:predicted RNA methylase